MEMDPREDSVLFSELSMTKDSPRRGPS